MTRINCIPPSELVNLHLLAEYRELPRISRLARHDVAIPSTYRLGKGHVTFFYDKGLYLSKRFSLIVNELKRRGYNVQYTEYRLHPDGLNNDWIPTLEDMEINRARIRERLSGQ